MYTTYTDAYIHIIYIHTITKMFPLRHMDQFFDDQSKIFKLLLSIIG